MQLVGFNTIATITICLVVGVAGYVFMANFHVWLSNSPQTHMQRSTKSEPFSALNTSIYSVILDDCVQYFKKYPNVCTSVTPNHGYVTHPISNVYRYFVGATKLLYIYSICLKQVLLEWTLSYKSNLCEATGGRPPMWHTYLKYFVSLAALRMSGMQKTPTMQHESHMPFWNRNRNVNNSTHL